MNNLCKLLSILTALTAINCQAAEELILTAQNKDGEAYPYVLNYESPTPKYVIILFPGGDGNMNPHMKEGKLIYGYKGNFVIKARKYIVDNEFATVATNSTQSSERVQAIISDIYRRFPETRIYLMGTSNGTFDTMSLAGYLSDKIAGVIHTSALSRISTLDAKQYKNRQLIVHHRNDTCKVTPFYSAEAANKKYGTELIVMEGGISVGDLCEPLAHHGFNGIVKETTDRIKDWIRQGK
jgi:hypothetical protein